MYYVKSGRRCGFLRNDKEGSYFFVVLYTLLAEKKLEFKRQLLANLHLVRIQIRNGKS